VISAIHKSQHLLCTEAEIDLLGSLPPSSATNFTIPNVFHTEWYFSIPDAKVQIKQQNTSLYEKRPPSKFLQPKSRKTKPTKGIAFHQLAGKGLYTHTTFFLGPPRRARTRRNLLDFMVQGEIAKADSPTIRLVATPTGLISDHLQQPPIFTPDTFPPQPSQFILVCTPNCLVPSGLVKLCSSALLSRRRSWHPSG